MSDEREAVNAKNIAFMQDLLASTTANPFSKVEIFDGSIHLGCIRSFERGDGNGSAALDWFCALADAHGISIRGTIKPCGETRPRLTAAQLRAWYKCHGFIVKSWQITRISK